VERAAFVVTPSRAERARADVPDRRVGTGPDLAWLARLTGRCWPFRLGSRPADPGVFREFVN
jgi:hypothetical protein